MHYPKRAKDSMTIATTAPSSGVTGIMVNRFKNAFTNLESYGHRVLEKEPLYTSHQHTSADAETRAKALMELVRDPEIDLILPPWGGEFLMEILPLLHRETIDSDSFPWIMGFSDLSTLLFYLTTVHDIATAHGPNMMDFSPKSVDPSVRASLDYLRKERFVQHTLPLYQEAWPDVEKDLLAPYQFSASSKIELLLGCEGAIFSGRLIGGCLDTIGNLLGTPYEDVTGFIERYGDDGILWYLENCGMPSPDVYRRLFQMKEAGWFEKISGLIVGRTGTKQEGEFLDRDAYLRIFGEMDIPVVLDADVGHLPPQLLLINGAHATVRVMDRKLELTTERRL
ncbi:S66 family peptidase [Acidaminobacter hydrogenoformans]|uniref:Muramoyltetrapeptide carboxypeptidase LdcA (Peptidoglycan recycling) n=1 Tax=Acidaminobacter hydrogenoformans DSM 2784 TaxID=1120920 RepID=A0A1G5S6V9_9FIRM|nr:S66 peptidase family protein [Acidaminobacter hydrogenoformans]SCZ82114.1 Muramoyltetrapeptide carboxypeptidase LdcA (peptidoglycan recycling) [Acidaminobacter hydrogenoformans DSM 2784]